MKFNILALSASVLGLSLGGISSHASAMSVSDYVSYDFVSSYNQTSYQTAAFGDNYDYADSVLSNYQAPAKSFKVNKNGDAVLTNIGQTAYRNYVSQVGNYSVDQSEFASQLYANDYMKKNPTAVLATARETDTSYLNNIVKSATSTTTNPLVQYASSNLNLGGLTSSAGSSSNLTNLSGFTGSNLLSDAKIGSTISTALGGSGGSSILTTLGSSASGNASSSLKGLAASFANYDSFLDFKKKQATKSQSSSGGLGGLGGLLGGSVNIGGITLTGGLGANGLTGSASLGGTSLASGGLGSGGLSGGLTSGLASGLTGRVTSGVSTATSGLSSAATSAINKEKALGASGLLSRF